MNFNAAVKNDPMLREEIEEQYGQPSDSLEPHQAGTDDDAAAPSLTVHNLKEFLSYKFQPREMILDPIITTQSVNLLAAFRGVGKTHCSLGMAWAVASGGSFLRWKASKPRRVLIIDGEMPGAALQSRLSAIMAGSPCDDVDPDMLRIITPDSQNFSIPNLANHESQEALNPALEGVELLILDNISTLTTTRENESDGWTTMQRWGLRLRKRGISSLLIHHTGFNETRQRGTSRREDTLDTSILLKRPGDYDPAEGARFEVHFSKGRTLHGKDAEPFEVRLEIDDSESPAAAFHIRDIDSARIEKVRALMGLGMEPKEIIEETGFSSSSVYRLVNKIKAGG